MPLTCSTWRFPDPRETKDRSHSLKIHPSSTMKIVAVLMAAAASCCSTFVPHGVLSGKRAAPFGVVNRALYQPLAMSTTEAATKETFEFTSDVGRVMDLIINSLYSDKVSLERAGSLNVSVASCADTSPLTIANRTFSYESS